MDLVEHQLQHRTERGKVRSPEELMELLLRLGDLTDEEIAERCSADAKGMLDILVRDNRAASVPLGGGRHWIAGEERDLYGTLPSIPALIAIVRRYLEHHGPVAAGHLARRYGIDPDRVREVLGQLSSDPSIVRGSFHAEAISTGEPEWCYRPNLERIYRQTVSLRRKEITPCSIEECTAFLLRWQHCHPATHVSGAEGLLDILPQLHALSLPAEIWEREVFMRRVARYDSSMMPAATHGIVWQGAEGGRMRMLFRGEGEAFSQHALPPPERQWGEPAQRILNHLERRGASFFNDLRSATRLSLDAMNAGLAELVWGGMVTNDLFAELAKVRRSTRLGDGATIERVEVVAPRFNPARGRILHSARKALRQVPGWSGRWSIVATDDILGPHVPLEEAAARQATQLLERYGVLAREFHRREDMLPWPLIAAELQRLELRGEIRRGYFVEGLSGMQYALPAAVEELQRMRSGPGGDEPTVLLNACDPANPFGPGVPLPGGTEQLQGRLMRVPGTYLAFRGGTPVLLLEHYGSRIWELAGADPVSVASALRELCLMLRFPETLRPFREIAIERINGEKPGQSRLAQTLRALGFERGRNQTMRVDPYSLRER
jgi:ATP-dependent helicase Lhr and Lhr-like helicase